MTFADVAGEEEAKKELTEVVDFLRNPAKYHQLGARLAARRAAGRSSGHRQDADGARGRR